MKKILLTIRQELKQNIDKAYQKNNQRFFKEPIKCHGVRTPIVRKIAKKYFDEISKQGVAETFFMFQPCSNKQQIFNLCEELLKSDYNEEACIAFDWIYRLRAQYEKQDFEIFEKFLTQYVNNWAKCDDFCNHSIGDFLEKFPEFLPILKTKWTKSENRWLRRASAVSLILPARRGKFLKEVFEIANLLLQDQDDLVQKGYGWLLKAASDKFPDEVLEFAEENKTKMPRIALRYAIERYPKEVRRKILNS